MSSRQRTPVSRLVSLLILPALVGLGGCVSSQDIQGLHDQLSEIQRQVLQLQKQSASQQELTDLSAEIAKQRDVLLKSEADMQVRLDSLSSQIEQLQSKLEDTQYKLSQLSQQIATTNQELKAARSSPPAGGEPGDASQPSPLIPADPEALYQAAYNDYLRGSYDLAVREFQEYLNNFPNTDLADNATYWIGECFYRQSKFRQAISEFDNVLNRYPRSDKLPSALLKKGYAYLELGERSQGVVQLQYVIREYPKSDEANLARQRLHELGIDSRP